MVEKHYRLGELTGGQMKNLVARDPVILLPMGSLEDQGPHAPVGDYLIAERLCEMIAASSYDLGAETLVAPVIPFGCDDYCGTSPGGIVLSPETFTAVVQDSLESLRRNGLNRIVVVNGHGGNIPSIQNATRRLYRENGHLVPLVNLWRSAHAILRQVVGPERVGDHLGHGADPLTSIVMHLFPSLVDVNAIKVPLSPNTVWGLPMKSFTNLAFEELDVQFPVDYHTLTPSGVWGGDPRLSSADLGAEVTRRLVASIARFVRTYASVGE